MKIKLTTLGHVRDWTGVNEIYIGRAGNGFSGYFGNPCIKGHKCPVCGKVHTNRSGLIACFEVYARKRIKTDAEFRQKVKGMLGKKLMCFCWPKKRCHGEVYIKLTEELNNVRKTMKTLF